MIRRSLRFADASFAFRAISGLKRVRQAWMATTFMGLQEQSPLPVVLSLALTVRTKSGDFLDMFSGHRLTGCLAYP